MSENFKHLKLLCFFLLVFPPTTKKEMNMFFFSFLKCFKTKLKPGQSWQLFHSIVIAAEMTKKLTLSKVGYDT